MILVAGDLHGDFAELNNLINRKRPQIVLQVGDFGYYPKEPEYDPAKMVNVQESKIFWCDGNHEDHESLEMIRQTEIVGNQKYQKMRLATVNNKQDIIDKIRAVLKRHPYIVRAELFGSLARGDGGHDSDVDLLVVYDENRPEGFMAFSIYGDLEEVLGRKVDLVQEKLMHDFILENIEDDRELIYERDEQ